MKWFLFLVSFVTLLAVFYFYPRGSEVKEVDPDKPWLALESAPESNEEKESRADDPRSVEDRILQKDYCAASDYFRYGRHASELAGFLRKALPPREDERRDLNVSTPPILAAQFAPSRDEAISKLRRQPGADTKLLLGMFQAGLAGNFQGAPLADSVHEALISLDEAEDLNPTNSLVPIMRAMVMQKEGASLEGIATFLKEELPKREKMDSPLSSARLDYLGMVSRDPLLFAAATPTFKHLEDSQLQPLAAFLGKLGEKDPAMARHVVRVADQWQKSELEKLSPDLPDRFEQLSSVELAAKLARDSWSRAYPGQPLPERFEEKFMAQLSAKHRDRNPIEERLYFGAQREESCGVKWREAIDADYEMVRDRLRKRGAR